MFVCLCVVLLCRKVSVCLLMTCCAMLYDLLLFVVVSMCVCLFDVFVCFVCDLLCVV